MENNLGKVKIYKKLNLRGSVFLVSPPCQMVKNKLLSASHPSLIV